MLYNVLALIVVPPAPLLIVAVAMVLLRGKAGARRVLGACVLLLYGLSTPLVADGLIGLLETYPPLTELPKTPQAIVVLSAEAGFAPEYGRDTVGELTLARLRYAADLHRRTGLPVLASGGVPGGLAASLGEMMAATLEQEFGVHPVWVESKAQDTWQNAKFSAPILAAHGVRDVFLVTSAFHMRRALIAFEGTGLGVIPAPTAYYGRRLTWFALIPQPRAMLVSSYALHEMMGVLYYRTGAALGRRN